MRQRLLQPEDFQDTLAVALLDQNDFFSVFLVCLYDDCLNYITVLLSCKNFFTPIEEFGIIMRTISQNHLHISLILVTLICRRCTVNTSSAMVAFKVQDNCMAFIFIMEPG